LPVAALYPSPPTPLPQGERGANAPPRPRTGRGGWGVRAVARGTVLRALPIVAGVLLIWVGWMVRNWAVHGSFSAEGNAGQTLVGRAMRHDPGFAFENPNDPDPV